MCCVEPSQAGAETANVCEPDYFHVNLTIVGGLALSNAVSSF